MSDWSKQTSDLVATWTETQKKMWDTWLGAMTNTSAGTSAKKASGERAKLLEAWHASLAKGLAAQSEWTKLWTEALGANPATPKPVLEGARQLQAMMATWTRAQTQLTGAWFELLKTADNPEMTAAWERQGQALLKSWQEATEQALIAQREMERSLAGKRSS